MKFNIKNNKGFTIVETLIVLAIAAVIIVIVLLAVPALQRTGRNSSIKTDATSIAGLVTEFESNNGGTPPTVISINPAGTVNANTGTAAAPTGTTATAKVQTNDSINTVTAVPSFVGSSPGASNVGPNVLAVRFQYDCSGSASANAVAIYYPIENGTSTGGVGCVQG